MAWPRVNKETWQLGGDSWASTVTLLSPSSLTWEARWGTPTAYKELGVRSKVSTETRGQLALAMTVCPWARSRH